LGTVSVAGPALRMTERRIRELAPLVTQCASELSTLWPLRFRAGAGLPAKDVAATA
jgi:hypothetical protein